MSQQPNLTPEERLRLVKRVVDSGERVSEIAKEAHISKTLLYKWLKRFKAAGADPLSLQPSVPKGEKHWRYIPGLEEHILKIVVQQPNYGPGKISQEIVKRTGKKLANVYKFLKRRQLATSEQRVAYAKTHGNLVANRFLSGLYTKMSIEEKISLIERVRAGEKLTHVCKEAGIPPNTFYEWLKRYQEARNDPQALASKRTYPKGEEHFSYNHEAPGHILAIVSAHPEYGASRIGKEIEQKLGRRLVHRATIERLLANMHLNTNEQRVAYATAQRPVALDVTPKEAAQQRTSILSLTKQFLFTALFSFLFFLAGSLVLDTLFRAQTLPARIGMFFAFTSLTCGMLFFFYSLKYYLTIAIILSFSRSDQTEKSQSRGIGAFLSKFFGISIEIENQNTSAAQADKKKPAISLQYDLSQVQLERHPFISIHVATYNEKRVIDRFLLAATSMEYDNYEIIVADDSTDETVQLLEQWKKHPRVKISHRISREGFKGAALEEALSKVDPRTEFILVFDADFIPYPDAIVQFLKYFQAMLGNLQPDTVKNSNIAAVQGYQWHVLNKSENWITRGVRTEYAGSYVIERSGTELYRGLKQVSGSVYMIRKDVLEKIGWGRSITEDFELTLRLYEEGFKVMYTPYIQTPAEAVSTIKRLIRQRIRWAEGHSFNVKRMFKQLLFSPSLSRSEKFEFLYLAPYYLQAFFFLLGTFCWFLSEVVFQVRLPFWTETWGWSLVLTNVFALPLMNLIGLFLERSEDRDYLGLFSFVILSYIIAPFQAFAAVKGFLEKEEGPWFRTPKTGRITDSFLPGRISRFVNSLLGRGTPIIVQSRLAPAYVTPNNFSYHHMFRENPYTPQRRKGIRWQSKSVLAVFLVATFILNYITLFPLVPISHASGNPTIEQQINIMDQAYTTSVNTSTGDPSDNSLGLISFNSTNYTSPAVYFESVLKATSGGVNVTAALYSSNGTAVTNATVTSSNTTSYERQRSAALPQGTLPSLQSGQDYTVRIKCGVTGGSCGSINAARLIIVQSDAGGFQSSQTQIEVGNNETTTATSNTALTGYKIYKYDDSKYSPSPTAYFEATMKSSNYTTNSTTSNNNCGTGAGDSSNPAGSTLNWTTPANACTGGDATVTEGGTNSTRYLKATNFGFTSSDVPSGATIVGVTAVAFGWQRGGNHGNIIDNSIMLINGAGSYVGTDHARSSSTTWPIPAPANVTWGSSSDNWSANLTQADVVNASFGVAISVKGTQSNDNQATNVTSVKVAITYQTLSGTPATVYAELYNSSTSAPVAASSISLTNTTWTRVRSGSLVGDTNWRTGSADSYYVRISTSNASGTGYIASAKVILDQNNAGGITKMETYHQYINAPQSYSASGSPGDVGTWSTATGNVTARNSNCGASAVIGGTTYVYILSGNYDNAVYKGVVNSTTGGIDSNFTTSGQGQLPQAAQGCNALTATFNGTTYLYSVGGMSSSSVSTNMFTRAALDSSGNVGTFTNLTNQLPSNRDFGGAAVATANGTTYMYSYGGSPDGNDTNDNTTIWKVKLNSDGTTNGAWSATNQATLPAGRDVMGWTQATVNGTTYFYAIGGCNTSGSRLNTIYKGTINSTTGDVDTVANTTATLNAATEMPMGATQTIGSNTYFYVIGGYDGSYLTSVYKATLNASGDVPSLSSTGQGSLPGGRYYSFTTATAVGSNYYLYQLAGSNGSSAMTTIYYSQITQGTYSTFGYANLYESGKWAGGNFTYYHEATIKGNPATGSFELNPGTALGQVTGVANTTFTLNRSSALTPVDSTEYDTEIQTATDNGSWLVIDISSLQVPENLLLFIPLLFFLPKIVESLEKRRKLRLAMRQSLMVHNITALHARKQYRKSRSRSPDTS